MKCEDCLLLIEEYADGELEAATGETVSTHLAACLECSEAFDALVGEQELYAGYQREVEVTPAMWQAVRAEVFEKPAATSSSVSAVVPPAFFVRLRERRGAAFGGLRLSPALAGSLALLVAGIAAGVLTFVYLKGDGRGTETAAVTNVENNSGSTPRAVVETPETGKVEPTVNASQRRNESEPLRRTEMRRTETAGAQALKAVGSGRARSMSGVAAGQETGVDASRAGDAHAFTSNEDPLLAPSRILVDPDEDPTRKNARALNVEEQEVARHVERAQLLLLSFRNVRFGEGTEGAAENGDVAYERQLSRELLDRNVSLRLNAELAGNLPARQVLDSLEPFLLDIANIKDDSSRDEVRSIKERIQKDEIIASLQVF